MTYSPASEPCSSPGNCDCRLQTGRLLLRPWLPSDAEDCYSYAKDPAIGPAAGWPVHRSVEESRDIILHVLMAPHNYALCRREDGRAIGCIGLLFGSAGHLPLAGDEAELGYWLGRPHQGQGMMHEAAMCLLRHAFGDLCLRRITASYFEGNAASRRVMERCGFVPDFVIPDMPWPLLNSRRCCHIMSLTREAFAAHPENALAELR